MLDKKIKELLVKQALEVREKAYSPYSDFCVGAALLCEDGEIFCGVNIENSSYGGTICAERSAICAAISQGKREFSAIAVVGCKMGETPDKICTPCGICRQFMSEFCGGDFAILTYDGQAVYENKLSELLPYAFGKDNL